MRVTIEPSKARGRMEAPPSKSMAHRMLICAGCAEGTSRIENIDLSEDVLATMDCLKALGAGITYEDRCVTVRGTDICGIHVPALLNCRECGSTLRFMIPLCLMSGQKTELTGSVKLFERPLGVYEKICREQGILFERERNHLVVEGKLRSGEYELPGNVSSQFISGLLFVLPLLGGDSRIRLTGSVESRPYIDMTMQAMEIFGVKARWEDESAILIRGGQSYCPRSTKVEGDFSNAAFFEALNLIGGDVEVTSLYDGSLQGDKVYRQYFDRIREGYAQIDLSDCPDLGPVLMAAAAMCGGAKFTGTARLRLKESDRGLAMQEELGKLGAAVKVLNNAILVEPGELRADTVLDGHNDHRIVMALAVILSAVGGSITGAEAVRKSLPDFWERFKQLGIGVRYDELDQ